MPGIDLRAWRLDTSEAELCRYRSHLSDDEAARAARFADRRLADRYVAGRGRMREILSTYTGGEPAALDLRTGRHGKPYIAGDEAAAPRFNLAHSQGVAVLAVSRTLEVGIDVEDVRPIERGVARRYFSRAEQEALAHLSGEEWLRAFYRGWTRKEALLKGLGRGLSIPLDRFDVTLGPGEPPRLLRFEDDPEVARRWVLHHFELPPGLIGAVAAPAKAAVEWIEFL